MARGENGRCGQESERRGKLDERERVSELCSRHKDEVERANFGLRSGFKLLQELQFVMCPLRPSSHWLGGGAPIHT